MRTAAHRGSWVKVVHVPTLTVFFSVFVFFRGNMTVVASLHRAGVFRVRLAGHCRDLVSNHVKTAPTPPLGEAGAPF